MQIVHNDIFIMGAACGVLVGIGICAVVFVVWQLRQRRKHQLYMHLKTKGVYVHLMDGIFERDGSACVIYAPLHSDLSNPIPWVRDYNEFHDGRFQPFGSIILPTSKKDL